MIKNGSNLLWRIRERTISVQLFVGGRFTMDTSVGICDYCAHGSIVIFETNFAKKTPRGEDYD